MEIDKKPFYFLYKITILPYFLQFHPTHIALSCLFDLS